MANVNFREKWAKMSWEQRAEIEYARGEAYSAIAAVDRVYEKLQQARTKHAKTGTIKEWLQAKIDDLEAAEFELQHLWGLKKDPNYHTYWLCPKACTCPKLDNMDYLGFGKIISEDCPLHGKKGFGKRGSWRNQNESL